MSSFKQILPHHLDASKASTNSVQTLYHKHVANSGLQMSACLASLTFFPQLVLRDGTLSMPLNWAPFWLVFSEALVIYSTDRIRDAKRASNAKDYSLAWVKLLQKIGAVALLAVLVWQQSLMALFLVVSHLFLGVLYAFPFKLSKRRCRLKDVPYFKSIFVAIMVSYMVIMAPLVLYQAPPVGGLIGWELASHKPALLTQTAMTVFILVLALENLQDIRDIKEDSVNGTKTIPVGLGTKRTKAFLCLVCTLGWIVMPRLANEDDIHACCVVPLAILLMLLGQFNQETPVRSFSHLEAIYLSPILAHWILSLGPQVDPFLVAQSSWLLQGFPC